MGEAPRHDLMNRNEEGDDVDDDDGEAMVSSSDGAMPGLQFDYRFYESWGFAVLQGKDSPLAFEHV